MILNDLINKATEVGVVRVIEFIILIIELIVLLAILIKGIFIKLQRSVKERYWDNIPGDLPPFAAGYLLSSYDKFEDCLAAEIANFIDMGILKESQSSSELSFKIIRKPDEKDELWRYQYIIFEKFIQAAANEDGIVTLESFKNRQQKSAFSGTDIVLQLDKELTSRDYINRMSKNSIRDKVFMVSFVSFMIWILACLHFGRVLADFFTIPIILLLILICKLDVRCSRNNLTNKGKKELKKWMSFKKFLENYGKFSDRGTRDVIIWRKFLVYACAFDLSDKLTDEVNDVMTKEVVKELKKAVVKMGLEFAKDILF